MHICARNILQHTATHCNTLQHTATHCTKHLHTYALYVEMCVMCMRTKKSFKNDVSPSHTAFAISHFLSSPLTSVHPPPPPPPPPLSPHTPPPPPPPPPPLSLSHVLQHDIISLSKDICVDECVHIYAYIRIYTNIYAYLRIRTHMYAYVRIYTHILICTYTSMPV